MRFLPAPGCARSSCPGPCPERLRRRAGAAPTTIRSRPDNDPAVKSPTRPPVTEPIASQPAAHRRARHFLRSFQRRGEESDAITDPFEPVNRPAFWFNDKLYFFVMKPAGQIGLRFVLPEPVRTGASHFLHQHRHAGAGDQDSALQFKGEDVATECVRFIMNSTVGVLGILDIAGEYGGVKKKDEDLGQTLGFYGVGSGFYLVLAASSARRICATRRAGGRFLPGPLAATPA